MKKATLILAALFTLAAYAQEPLTLIVDRNGIAGYDYNCILAGQGNERYVCTDFTMVNTFTHVAQEIITCVSKKSNTGRKIAIERPMEYNLLAFYEGEDNINCVYSIYESSSKSYALYLNRVSKKATKGSWNPEKVLSFQLERREDVLVGGAVSPDQTKAVVVLFQVNKAGVFQADQSDKLKGSAVVAFGEEGMLWANPLELDFPNTTLNIFDIAVNNNAIAYVAISSYNKSKASDEAKENETLHLFEVGAEETRSAEEQPSFGNLNNGKLLLCASGDIIVGGYYKSSNKKKRKADGSYMATFDGKQLVGGSFSTQPFPQSYFDYKHPKTSKDIQEYEPVPVDFKEFGNGTKVLLGEPRTEISIPNYTNTYFGNILVSFADTQGQLNEFQMIRKDQVYMNAYKSTKHYQSMLSCFNTIMHNDKLYIFFSDNLANHTGKTGQAFVIANTNYKKKCGLFCVIESDGSISKPEMFMNYQNYKSVIYRPLSIDEDGLLIYNSNKLNGAVSKLKHKF